MSAGVPISYSMLPPPRKKRGALRRGIRWLASSIFWVLLGIGLIGGATSVARSAIGNVGAAVAPAGVFLLLVCGAVLAAGARRVRDASLLLYLEQAMRLNAPLGSMLAAAEASEHGALRSGLRLLRRRLEMGDPLFIAVADAAPALPARITGLVGAGEDTGRLVESLRRITTQRGFLGAPNPAASIYRRWYPIVLSATVVIIAEILLIFVFPKFSAMGVMPEGLTVHMAFGVDLDEIGPVMLAIPSVLIALCCGRMLARIFSARAMGLGPLAPVFEVVRWYIPITSIAERSAATADACYVIANASEAGIPLNRAIASAAPYASNLVYRRKLRRWSRRIASGMTPAAAARKAAMPALVGGMLATATSEQEIRDVLRFLCQYYDGRFARYEGVPRSATITATVLVFGVIVLLLSLGVFQPLVDLMNKYWRLI